ncbi:MAG: phosphorylase [Xanthomarina sp.]|uniref:Uridine phosphorylase n=1 Tax=Xanthomarina gelatinilytica TaxID=1137281 RepID=M7MGZ3_9FLAO|nr:MULTISPECIES: nucleoside phosphorylase [Flavobacteriaceae]MCB0388660.1 nucleoside phosphorylase [Winogradskyella sp.]EMQ94341.1 Purine nucleoside phosphorylase [Xanthomarina gelatinilytica]MAL23468.1 phosphorylase [Xanthomarina sp.]MBF61202.1 phosphorylase [Xanthomarina sp.]HAB28217.1 phosphorylase [Xanthomarina gelatinilytica]|tara:strand:- start:1330 stop:2196 length:867 start_codon:yes stop_codon:yes gene_type:complete
MSIKDSELILNPDGSIYHLNLKPEHIAHDILLVGDQDRVEKITKHFDSIEFATQKREFKTQTGYYKGKRLTVLSTGIGPDNIDIVLNELDALVNIDLKTRKPKETHTSLNFVRVGTSGSLQADVPVDGFVISSHGLDLNGMLHFYKIDDISNPEIEEAFVAFTNWNNKKARPIVINNSKKLEAIFDGNEVYKGLTATAGGFYGPQGRVLRLPLQDPDLNKKMDTFSFNGMRITNFEMETSVIYGLSKLLGHHALSLNAIIANRATGQFSKDPKAVVERLIAYTLNKLV